MTAATGRPSLRAPRASVGIALAAALAFAGSAAVGLLIQIHEPELHDEFSYLLAADTYAHGRLTNPTPPAWEHFESFHIILRPSYASKYLPAQGAVLALGEVLFGHPIAGVWLSNALMAGAIAWLLYAWVPGPWPLAGALLAVAQLSLAGYWSQSYWGGAVAAAGGALVYGALRRLTGEVRVRDGAILAAGLAILATSRPLEGAVAALPAGVVLLVSAWRNGPWDRVRALAPVAAGLLATLVWLGYFDARVTGDPLLTPYQVHTQTYLAVPLFMFQPIKPIPAYRHRELRQLHGVWDVRWYLSQRTFGQVISALRWKLPPLWSFYLGWGAAIPLLALPWILRRRWNQLALGTCLLLLFTSNFVTLFGGLPHYVAPATALLVALQTEGLRWLAGGAAGWRRIAGRGAVALCGLIVAAGAVHRISEHRVDPGHWSRQRAETQRRLAELPGHDLVLVSYGPEHVVHREWVYNEADLEHAQVVWARAMDPAADAELIRRFPDRRVWRLRVDSDAGPFPLVEAGPDQEVPVDERP